MQRCRVLGRIVNKAYWPLQWENTITYHNTLCWSLQECSDWGPVHTYPDIFESANFSLRILKLINNSWRYKPTRSPHSGQVDDFETHWNISWKSLVFHHVFITSERHFKLQTDWLFFFLFRFQTNANSSPILHFCVQYSSKDSKSNEEKEKIDAISLRFKISSGWTLSNLFSGSETFLRPWQKQYVNHFKFITLLEYKIGATRSTTKY